MSSAPPLAGRIGLVAVAVAVVGSVAACGSTSVTDSFKSKITASDFQASGPISGSFTMVMGSMTINATLSGTMKIKGKDSAQTMTMDIAAAGTVPASSTTTDTITVGDSEYTRTDGGAWSKAARPASGLDTYLQSITLTDKGVETHNGQQLHRLESTTAFDPKALFSSTTGVSNPKLTLTGWAKDDGTPAGLTISGTFDQDQGGQTVNVTVQMEVNFDNWSGITIEAPSM